MAKRKPVVPPGDGNPERVLLHCPLRGPLKASVLAKDGLTQSEEARRIDFIKYLLDRRYLKTHIAVETVVLKGLGEGGRNKLRADVIAYSEPVGKLASLASSARLAKAVIVAEIKRDSAKKASAISCQLEPAMRMLPGMDVLGVYWDDINRLLFTKRTVRGPDGQESLEIVQDTLANLPVWGHKYKAKPITIDSLIVPENFVGILDHIANALRSEGIYADAVRYKETVKLLLARYCDEKDAAATFNKELKLQEYPGADPDFMQRVQSVYKLAGRRYSRAKTLFKPNPESELKEHTLRRVIKQIQGVNLSSASNETMQQVFMSFVPAVFKKVLDQYFTPITLINTMVSMVSIGPNDKVADPAMGTGDFLTAAMAYRTQMGDTDAMQRVFGADIDPQAYELAVINMILNKDGQNNFQSTDTIENASLWFEEMDVALCNPPFGMNSVENRPSVLAQYELGHDWEYDTSKRRWMKTDTLRSDQQFGILFIERCFKMLADGGRLAIIMPEGYLCTPSYAYVRQWIVDNLQILSLTELPRRIFFKSDADLRSNIMIAKKLSPERLVIAKTNNYPIHCELVRKVGFKMGKGNSRSFLRDPLTGLEIRDSENRPVIDTDFNRVRDRFARFSSVVLGEFETYNVPMPDWGGACIYDITNHSTLDMKPRRLSLMALANIKQIKASDHFTLGSVADIQEDTVDILVVAGAAVKRRLVAGMEIRAVEGTVVPRAPARSWEIAEQKSRFVFQLKKFDIVIGLVRPERRNIGLLLDPGADIVGSPDGVAIVRVKPLMEKAYPQLWLFAALRSEACRLQFWTESGGTSYGKLTNDQIRNVLIPKPTAEEIANTAEMIRQWTTSIESGQSAWEKVGSVNDRVPIINSAIFGLAPEDITEEDAEEDE